MVCIHISNLLKYYCDSGKIRPSFFDVHRLREVPLSVYFLVELVDIAPEVESDGPDAHLEVKAARN